MMCQIKRNFCKSKYGGEVLEEGKHSSLIIRFWFLSKPNLLDCELHKCFQFFSPLFDETGRLEQAGTGYFPFSDQLGSDNTSLSGQALVNQFLLRAQLVENRVQNGSFAPLPTTGIQRDFSLDSYCGNQLELLEVNSQSSGGSPDDWVSLEFYNSQSCLHLLSSNFSITAQFFLQHLWWFLLR